MHIRHLSLSNFRSYRGLEVDFPAGPQVVVGPNAAGKTNLLESLVVLSRGSSHRTGTDAELVGWNADLARLEATLGPSAGSGGLGGLGGLGGDRIEVVLMRPGAVPGARKRVRVNEVPRRTTILPSILRAVVFAPEDMLLVVGSPSLRRGVLDAIVVQREPEAASAMSTYGRALTQRNTLLRRIREEQAGRDELRYWDQVVLTEGGRMLSWRHDALAALAEPLAAANREIAPGEGRLSLRYLTNAEPQPGEAPVDALRRRLAETADKELWNGATLVGPHRDDLAFELDGRDLSGFASRGQQRTAILALKLAELDILTAIDGRPPLLLLDDVFSELDPERRSHLVRRIGELPQAFVTTTTLDDLDPALVRASTAWTVTPGELHLVTP